MYMFLSVNVLILVWRVSYVFIIIAVGTYIQITPYMYIRMHVILPGTMCSYIYIYMLYA